jgi:hypothetical protein
LAKAALVVIASAVLKMIAAETAIFPIVDMGFSFLISWLRDQLLPNIDPGSPAKPDFPATVAGCGDLKG